MLVCLVTDFYWWLNKWGFRIALFKVAGANSKSKEIELAFYDLSGLGFLHNSYIGFHRSFIYFAEIFQSKKFYIFP